MNDVVRPQAPVLGEQEQTPDQVVDHDQTATQVTVQQMYPTIPQNTKWLANIGMNIHNDTIFFHSIGHLKRIRLSSKYLDFSRDSGVQGKVGMFMIPYTLMLVPHRSGDGLEAMTVPVANPLMRTVIRTMRNTQGELTDAFKRYRLDEDDQQNYPGDLSAIVEEFYHFNKLAKVSECFAFGVDYHSPWATVYAMPTSTRDFMASFLHDRVSKGMLHISDICKQQKYGKGQPLAFRFWKPEDMLEFGGVIGQADKAEEVVKAYEVLP